MGGEGVRELTWSGDGASADQGKPHKGFEAAKEAWAPGLGK